MAVHYGDDLVPGDVLIGPAVIEEPTTTLVISSRCAGRRDTLRHYLVTLDD